MFIATLYKIQIMLLIGGWIRNMSVTIEYYSVTKQ